MNFREDIRVYLRKKILKTRDFTYCNLKGIINAKILVTLKGGKDSSVVIMDKLIILPNFIE